VTVTSPIRRSPHTDSDPGDRLLAWAASAFTVAVLLHNADHLRRGVDAVARDVFWAGTSSIAIEVAVVVLACQRHRLAPLFAAATGWSLTAGYVVVHFLPARSWLSDSLPDGTDVSPLSWAAASLEVAAAVALGVAGTLVLRRRGGLASVAEPHPGQRELSEALRHPAVLAMALGNVVVLIVSFAQL
jgi:hypothetical protein